MTTFLVIFCIVFFGSLIISAIYNNNKTQIEKSNQIKNEQPNNQKTLIVYTDCYIEVIYPTLFECNEKFERYSVDEIETMTKNCTELLVSVWQKKVNDVYDTNQITKTATKYILPIIMYCFFDMENFLRQKEVPFAKFDILHQLTRASDKMLDNLCRTSFNYSQDVLYHFLSFYGGHK